MPDETRALTPVPEAVRRVKKALACPHRNAKSAHCTTFECKKLRQRIGLDTCRACPETDPAASP